MNAQTALEKVTQKMKDLTKIRDLEKGVAAVDEAKAATIDKVTFDHAGGQVSLDPGASSDAVADAATGIINGELATLKAAFNLNAAEDLTIT